MTHQTLREHETEGNYLDTMMQGEPRRSLGRQLATSIGGMLALLVIGLVVLFVVLWKAP